MSLAIKYGMMKKANGGMCEHGSRDCKMCHGGEYAEGGEVAAQHEDEKMDRFEDMEAEDALEDMVDRIIRERMEGSEQEDMPLSEGGKISNEVEDFDLDKEPNEFDELVKDDDLEFHETGENSGDYLGDEQEDEDRRDIVKRIMRQRMLKNRPSSGSNERVD